MSQKLHSGVLMKSMSHCFGVWSNVARMSHLAWPLEKDEKFYPYCHVELYTPGHHSACRELMWNEHTVLNWMILRMGVPLWTPHAPVFSTLCWVCFVGTYVSAKCFLMCTVLLPTDLAIMQSVLADVDRICTLMPTAPL